MPLFKKEKRVVNLVQQHIEKTAECVQETTDRLKAAVVGKVPESSAAASRVDSLESEADKLLREIRDLLYSGAYLPLIRGDIYRLMSTIDNVSNKAEGCFDFFNEQMPVIPEEYHSGFTEALELTAECFNVFREALDAFFGPKDNIEKVRDRSRAVGELESRIDAVEKDLTTRIFGSSLEMGSKIHLRQALRRIAAVSDATEDAADELELINLKSII